MSDNAQVEGGGSDRNPLFDRAWYLERYPDVAASGGDPFVHYLEFGAERGYDPHPLFDTSYYLEQYRDVAEAGVNPLNHFLEFGAAEGRHPHPMFDTSWYLKQHPEIAAAGLNPLLHYLTTGAAEGRNPHPHFDTALYRDQNPEIATTGMNPLEHYVRSSATGVTVPRTGRRIQLHRHGSLGDVLLITPLLKELRKKYRDDEIVVSTEYPEILRGNPYLDGLVRSALPRAGFDETLVLEYETRPEEHIVDAYARVARVPVTGRTPEIYLSHEERIAAGELLRNLGIRRYERFCVMQVTSHWRVRDWFIERFKEVAAALEKEGLRVVVLGLGRRKAVDFGIDLRDQTDIRTAAAIIEKCALMVTVDSGLMHIAYAFRRPVLALFGCTDPEKRVPDWALPLASYSEVVCRGCHHRQRPVPKTSAPDCPWETVRCMEALSTEMVIAKARAVLARAEKPLVSIVIPHYFKWHLLNSCLESILRHGAQCSFEVVVVANGSPEESLRQLEGWRPNVRIVVLQPNQGFARACNAGARAARGRYVLFLNDDTTVTPGWLDEMVAFLESDPRIGIVGPKLLFPENDRIQHCGTVINERGMGEHIYGDLPGNFVPANRPRFYKALTGACLLIERDFFLMLGEFETSYHGTGGCEDTDLCFSVLDHGKMVAYCPTSVVHHYEGVTRGRRGEHHPEEVYNRRLLRQRWKKYLAADVSDYCLLAEIEAGEGTSWRWLQEVPMEIVSRYDSPQSRAVGRRPFRIQIGSAARPEPGYLHVDAKRDAPSVDIIQDIFEPLPFSDGMVAVILALGVIERVSPRTLPQVLGEFHRVLPEGGRLVIRTPSLRLIVEDYVHGANGVEFAAGEPADPRRAGPINPMMQRSCISFGGGRHNADSDQSSIEGESLASLCRAIGFSEARWRRVADDLSRDEIEVVALR